MMQDSSLTTSYIYDGDTRAKLSLWGGDYYWEFINDPAASIPAVLVSKGHTDLETTYVYYVREPGGELVASFDSAETPNTLYYHFDDLGSTVLTTDGSGGDLGHSTYRAWGWPTTSDAGPYLFCGRLGYYEHTQDQNWLEQSSLLQLGVRFYDRDIGRFTQRDPIAGSTSTAYAYVAGAPLRYVDPSGLTGSGHETDLDWTTGEITCECHVSFDPFDIPRDVLDFLAQLGVGLIMRGGYVKFTYIRPLGDRCKDPGHCWRWSPDWKKEAKRRRGKYYDDCDNSCAYLCQYTLPGIGASPNDIKQAAQDWADKVEGNYNFDCK